MVPEPWCWSTRFPVSAFSSCTVKYFLASAPLECTLVQQSIPLMCCPQPLGQLTHFRSFENSTSSDAYYGLEHKRRQTTDSCKADDFSFFFSDTPLGRTQPVPEKAVSYTTGLNSWVFAPRCLTALACIALLPLQVLTVPSANLPVFWSRQVSCRSLSMAVIHSVAFPYSPHSVASMNSYSSPCNGLRLPASPHPSPRQDVEELWRPHRMTSPWGSLTQLYRAEGSTH